MLARSAKIAGLLVALLVSACPAFAAEKPEVVLQKWYRLALELVRHTPTYSPPVASRAFAYLGVTVHEAGVGGDTRLRSLAGQLNAMPAMPARRPDGLYDEAAVLHFALAEAAKTLFANTGPTGQRSLQKLEEKLGAKVRDGLPPDTANNSEAHGRAIAAAVLQWSQGDGGAVVENLGFPASYELKPGKANWVPTNTQDLQQKPLLPGWGGNRPFAMPKGNACPLSAPPQYSEAPGSQFHAEAMETYEAVKNISQQNDTIARFWSDDPMLSPTPPGHWIMIALDILDRDGRSAADSGQLLAKLGVTLADAFIGCWHTKFEYDLLRPVTYINRVIDPSWKPLLITPPFPEYPSGHSTQSGAAEVVLTDFFGENFAFIDKTHIRDGIAERSYASFRAAAEEAGISRLYGGIHFRAAIERGLEQGRCIGAHAVKLRTGE
jgi:hypothetical protein